MKTTYRKRNQPPRRRNLLPVAVLLVVLVAAAIIAVALLTGRNTSAPAVPDTGTSAGAWMKNENGYYFNNAGEVILPATLKGIDVSQYQGEIDWQKAKDAGIDFAIIRCGYGSEWYGVEGYNQDDPY